MFRYQCLSAWPGGVGAALVLAAALVPLACGDDPRGGADGCVHQCRCKCTCSRATVNDHDGCLDCESACESACLPCGLECVEPCPPPPPQAELHINGERFDGDYRVMISPAGRGLVFDDVAALALGNQGALELVLEGFRYGGFRVEPVVVDLTWPDEFAAGRLAIPAGASRELSVVYHVDLAAVSDGAAVVVFESNDPRAPVGNFIFDINEIGRMRANPGLLALVPGGVGEVTLSNIGSGHLELTEDPEIAEDPEGALSLELGPGVQAGAVLVPGETAGLEVRCRPEVSEAVRAYLVVATNDPEHPQTRVPIRVDLPVEPRLSVSPSELVFVDPPTWAPRLLVLANTGTGALWCNDLRVEPSAARGVFTLSHSDGRQLEPPLLIAAGEEQTLRVEVSVPPDQGGVEAELVVFTNEVDRTDVHVPLSVPPFEP